MRTSILGVGVSLLLASAAQADVIEISDDGVAYVVGAAPTDEANLPHATLYSEPVSDPFETSARRHGIDVALLRAVAWAESRGRNDAVSPKGALGIMQLMPATAASLGVDPRDPIANIDGGAAYLARQLATFHNVPLALAAYNAGPGAVRRYRGVPPFAETRDYVAKIMRRLKPQLTGAASGGPASGADKGSPFEGSPSLAFVETLPILMIEVP